MKMVESQRRGFTRMKTLAALRVACGRVMLKSVGNSYNGQVAELADAADLKTMPCLSCV